MRRFVLLVLFALLTALPTAAQTDIAISFPPPVWVVSGTVEVRGTVNNPAVQAYFLEARPDDPAVSDDAATWTPVSLPSFALVTDAVIGTWDTTRLDDGVYRLRLKVVLTTGETQFALVAPVRVANNVQTVVVGGEPTAAAPLVAAVATAAPLGVLPTLTLPPAPPTATPVPEPTTPPRPVVNNTLPIPVGGHISNFNDTSAELMKGAGMTWMKWQIPFMMGDSSLVQVAADRINWSHQHGFLVLLSIKGSKDELASVGRADYFPAYAEFVGQVAALTPDAIQIWNEMNIDREWPTGQIDPAMYVDLLRQSYEAIKAADPTVKVITGAPAPTGAEGAFGTSRVWNDDRYYLGMANAGAADYADCIGIHYNEGIIPPSQQGGDPRGTYPTYYFPLMIQRAAFPFRASGIPLCFSEMGYLTPEGYGQLPEGFAWGANTSVEEQATWLRDAIQLASEQTAAQIDLIIIWNVDFSNFDQDPMAGFAIIRPDGTCPACDAIATLRTQ